MMVLFPTTTLNAGNSLSLQKEHATGAKISISISTRVISSNSPLIHKDMYCLIRFARIDIITIIIVFPVERKTRQNVNVT